MHTLTRLLFLSQIQVQFATIRDGPYSHFTNMIRCRQVELSDLEENFPSLHYYTVCLHSVLPILATPLTDFCKETIEVFGKNIVSVRFSSVVPVSSAEAYFYRPRVRIGRATEGLQPVPSTSEQTGRLERRHCNKQITFSNCGQQDHRLQPNKIQVY